MKVFYPLNIYIYVLIWIENSAVLNQNNKIIMTLECLVSNPVRKEMFHQDYINLRSLIIIYAYERFFQF